MNYTISLIFPSLLSIFFSLLIYTFYKFRKLAEDLEKDGIPYLGLGITRLIKFVGGSISAVELEQELFNEALKTNSPVVGVTDVTGVLNLFITDIQLMRSIYVKDFDHFVNRRPMTTENSVEYMSKMMFLMNNEKWKGMRAKLSPTFTTGKIRKMFQIFLKSSEKMDAYLKKQMMYPKSKSVDLNFLKIVPKYTLDVIASCVLGVESEAFDVSPDHKSRFEERAHKYGFHFNGKIFLKKMLMIVAPKVADYFRVDTMDYESQEYLARVTKDVIRRRRETGERRDDFLQLLMDAQQGLLKADEESMQVMDGSSEAKNVDFSKETESQLKYDFDDEKLIANGLMFLVAGFDTTQSAFLFMLYSLVVEQEVQEKLFKEVESVLKRNNGQLTYDSVMEMTYLDMVLNESLRYFTSVPKTERICNKDFQVPGTNRVIRKGSIIWLSMQGIHHDPRYFPNPEKFIPERFSAENKASLDPYAFMPFGHGPRNCIAMRFVLVKVKAAIAQLVHSFHFAPCAKTKIPMVFDRNLTVKPYGDMWVKVTARE